MPKKPQTNKPGYLLSIGEILKDGTDHELLKIPVETLAEFNRSGWPALVLETTSNLVRITVVDVNTENAEHGKTK